MRKRRLPPPPSPPPEGFVLRRGRSGELEEFPIEMIQQMSDWNIKNSSENDWSYDPTYNLRKRK